MAAAAGSAAGSASIPDIEDLAKARDFEACSCPSCASLCHGIPGVYDPGHLERLLKGGLTLDQLVKTCVIDFYSMVDEERPIFYLRPRLKAEVAGATVSIVPTVSSCAHLTTTGCGLSRDEMPIGCISGYGCQSKEGIDKQNAPELWDNDKGRSLIERFETAAARADPSYTFSRRAWETDMATAKKLGYASVVLMQLAMIEVEKNRRAAEDRLKAAKD